MALFTTKNFVPPVLSLLLTVLFLTAPPVEAASFDKDGHFPTTSGSNRGALWMQ